MKRKYKILSAFALASAFTVSGWLLTACSNKKDGESFDNENNIIAGGSDNGETLPEQNVNSGDLTVTPNAPNGTEVPEPNEPGEGENNVPTVVTPKPSVPEQPEEDRAEYIKITSDGVNIRSGAGTGYASLGTAEKNTLYVLKGKSGNWYKTVYRHKTAYIHSNYCTTVDMDRCASDTLEKVIEKGYECLGVPYVFGAVRYHDGNGNRLNGFSKDAFDCSSLMQYMFKLAAGVNLQLTTRTQIYQGTTVKKSNLRRGDLMFFTNASRKNLSGIERVGHVAIYLGDNYILHTASDYAKIEQISSTRWSYYIQSQRII